MVWSGVDTPKEERPPRGLGDGEIGESMGLRVFSRLLNEPHL